MHLQDDYPYNYTFVRSRDFEKTHDSFPGEVIKVNTPITYDCDEHGYRNPCFTIGSDVAFGCSCTYGYGVNNPWPQQLSLYNHGINASSNDQIARMVANYLKFYTPKKVFVLWTFNVRREWFNDKSKIYEQLQPRNPDVMVMEAFLTLSNPQADQDNFEKNQNYVRAMCKANDVELYELHVEDFIQLSREPEFAPLARDDKHPGEKWHQHIAGKFNGL